jgi:hypothetical protein
MRLGHRHALGSSGTSGVMANSLTSPGGERHADFFGLLVGGDAGGEARGHRIAADDVAARRAAALAAGEHPQQAGGRAARGRGELVLGNVDHPGALADRHAAERNRVAGVQPALCQRPDRLPPRRPAVSHNAGAQTEATVQARFVLLEAATRFAAPGVPIKASRGERPLIPDFGANASFL